MQKKLTLNSDGGDSGSKKCKRDCGGTYSGVWKSLESGGLFCFSAFSRNLASAAVKMFSHLIYFQNRFYNLCAFNAICKDSAAVNCDTVQQEKGSFP
jgi:hypothetical protein